jgi:hypothetical protein
VLGSGKRGLGGRRDLGAIASTNDVLSVRGSACGTRRRAQLTGKKPQSYVVAFPQITDAQDSDEDGGIEYDFR